MKKNIINLSLVFFLIFILTGCGKKDNGEAEKGTPSVNYTIAGIVKLNTQDKEIDLRRNLKIHLGYGESLLNNSCVPANLIKSAEIDWVEETDGIITGNYILNVNSEELLDSEYMASFDCECKSVKFSSGKKPIKIDFDFSKMPRCAQ